MPDNASMGDFNPYQAPTSTSKPATSGPLGDWLARPSPSLSKVRSGIGIIYTANMMILVAIVCGVFGMVIPPALLIMIPLLLIAWIMSMVGQVYCLAAPRESGGRGIIYGSTILMFSGMIISFANSFLIGSTALGLITNLVSVLGNFLFLVFLLQLAKVIGKKSLVTRAKVALGAAVLTIGLACMIVAVSLMAPNTPLVGIWAIVLGLSILIFVATYLTLLNDLSNLLRVRRVASEPQMIWPTGES